MTATPKEPFSPAPRQTSFVYDKRTGEVVHIHQFLPLDAEGHCDEAEMEQTALHLAASRIDRKELAVLHHKGELNLEPHLEYRVDPRKRALVPKPIRDAGRSARTNEERSK